MTTELEIIDTAVKVGLGAAISGVTTYLVTIRTQRHELRKDLCKERTDLLKKGATLFESSGALVNHAIRRFENMKFGEIENQTLEAIELSKEFTNAFNEAKEARMLFHLIGDSTMAGFVSKHLEAMDKLRRHLVHADTGPDINFLNANWEERKKARDDLLGGLSKALESLHL